MASPFALEEIVGKLSIPFAAIFVLPLFGAIPCAAIASPRTLPGYIVSYVLHAFWGFLVVPIIVCGGILLFGLDEEVFSLRLMLRV